MQGRLGFLHVIIFQEFQRFALIHFRLIFVKDMRSRSSFFLFSFFSFWHVNVQLLQHNLLKTLYLLHCIAFGFYQRSADYIQRGLYLGFLFCFIIYVFIFSPIPHSFDYCSFRVSLEDGQQQSPNFVFLHQYYVGNSEFLINNFFLYIEYKHCQLYLECASIIIEKTVIYSRQTQLCCEEKNYLELQNIVLLLCTEH